MFSNDFLNEEAMYKLGKFVEMGNKLNRDDLINKTGNKKKDEIYDFQNFKVIRSFGREIYNNDLSQDDALEQQIKNLINKSKKTWFSIQKLLSKLKEKKLAHILNL